MNRNTEKVRLASVSKRARKLFERIESGRFYRAYGEGNPKAMTELLDAGLIKRYPKVVVIASAMVPHNYEASYVESYGKKKRRVI